MHSQYSLKQAATAEFAACCMVSNAVTDAKQAGKTWKELVRSPTHHYVGCHKAFGRLSMGGKTRRSLLEVRRQHPVPLLDRESPAHSFQLSQQHDDSSSKPVLVMMHRQTDTRC